MDTLWAAPGWGAGMSLLGGTKCVLGGLVTMLLLPAEPGLCGSDLRQKGLGSTVFLTQFLLPLLCQKGVSSL